MVRRKRFHPLKDKILTILAASAEVLDTVGDFTYSPHSYLYASLGNSYSKENIDDAVTSLTLGGLLEGDKSSGLRITLAGADIKKSLYRERHGKWDGKWRGVFFDIPEAQRKLRDDLRSGLKKLGFGLWQRSVWITPFDITKELNSYLQKQGLSTVVQIMVGERFGQLNDRDFAFKVWPLKEINERYMALLSIWGVEIGKESTAKERMAVVASLHNRYLDILASDPQLPLELLPSDWVGNKAKALFRKLKSTLVVS